MTTTKAPEVTARDVVDVYDAFERGDYPGGAREAREVLQELTGCTGSQSLELLGAGQNLGVNGLDKGSLERWSTAVRVLVYRAANR